MPAPAPRRRARQTAAFAYHLDAAKPGVQSGRPFSILLNFKRLGVQVEEMFPLEVTGLWQRKMEKVRRLMLRQRFLLDRHEKLLRSFADQLHQSLEHTAADFIFSPSTLPLSYLETDLPTTFCADSPFCSMVDYYDSFTRLSSRQLDLSEKLEARVLSKAALSVYPTRWAAEQAGTHYGIPPERLAVIPFGANFGHENRREEVERWIENRSVGGHLRLLFVGREWKRKGGPLVLETAKWLRARGLRVRVDFVGCSPPPYLLRHADCHVHGNLIATRLGEAELLHRLYRQAHFLFVPSRAEAYGMTFCEANAFGIPAITTATGGITDIIRPGVNGHALPLEAGPEEYGNAILESFQSTEDYHAFCHRAFSEFEQRLNWGAFARQFLDHPAIVACGSPSAQKAEPVPELKSNPESSAETAPPIPPMRIAYVTVDDPADPYGWSGINHRIANALREQGMEVIPIGPLKRKVDLVGKLWSILANFLPGGRYLWRFSPRLLRNYARRAERLLAQVSCDVIFSPGSHSVAWLNSERPVVFWTDAPFAAVCGYYPWYTHLGDRSLRDGQELDTQALRRATFACYSSQWAADHAISGHRGDPARVKVIPLGANLPGDIADSEVPALVQERLQGPWRLLFVGVEWERKGGDLVLATAQELTARGFPVELNIVGCEIPPAIGPLPEWVKPLGFISQHTTAGQQRLAELFRSALFFFMPSQAEAYGIVFCEANSFAVPCLSRATGGITSIIENGRNGQLFHPEAPAREYADFIIETASSPERYAALAADSRRVFRERLNWQTSVAELIKVLWQAAQESTGASLSSAVQVSASPIPSDPAERSALPLPHASIPSPAVLEDQMIQR